MHAERFEATVLVNTTCVAVSLIQAECGHGEPGISYCAVAKLLYFSSKWLCTARLLLACGCNRPKGRRGFCCRRSLELSVLHQKKDVPAHRIRCLLIVRGD